ncbi:MAG: DNA methyltransferase [Candidatus Hodarchaeales archaeon]|jgi:tRNA (guanine10-N2)-dimethyltransferase
MITKNQSVYFCFLSGENPDLALYELESVIKTLKAEIIVQKSADSRIIRLVMHGYAFENLNQINYILNRVIMVHYCFEKIYEMEFEDISSLRIPDIFSDFDKDQIVSYNSNSSFRVKTKRIRNPSGFLGDPNTTQIISKILGADILRKFPKRKVDLQSPDEIYLAIISKYGLWFGLHIISSLRGETRQRTARSRPFFHPSSMNPILQRTLVNLAALKKGDWLLDPFCGSGGALLEAARLGVKCIGIEVDRRITWGALRNLKSDLSTNELTNLIRGDATHLCIRQGVIQGIVTDPPYGTAASTQGYNLKVLLLEAFTELAPLLESGSRIVIAVPSTLQIEDEISEVLKATYRTFYQYVHRSLTRKILVFSLE